jgi:hypothetical protein
LSRQTVSLKVDTEGAALICQHASIERDEATLDAISVSNLVVRKKAPELSMAMKKTASVQGQWSTLVTTHRGKYWPTCGRPMSIDSRFSDRPIIDIR